MNSQFVTALVVLAAVSSLAAQPTQESFVLWQSANWDPVPAVNRYRFVFHEPTRVLGFMFPEVPPDTASAGRIFTVGTIGFNQDLNWDIVDAVFNNGWSDLWSLSDDGAALTFGPLGGSSTVVLPPTADQRLFWPGITNTPPPPYASQLPDTLMPMARLAVGQILTPDMVVRAELAFVGDPSLFALPLTFEVIPEPSSIGLMSLGVLLLRRQRRVDLSGYPS